MKPLLLAVLFSFLPSPDASVHLCWTFDRAMEWAAPPQGEQLGPLRQAACNVLGEWEGWGWARSECSDQPGTACAVCIVAVDETGTPSECGDVEAYMEDQR